MKTRARAKAAETRRRAPVPPSPLFDHPAAEILHLIRKHGLAPVGLAKGKGKRAARGPDSTVLHDLVAAQLLAWWNEISFDGKPNTNDPIKWRFGAFRSDQTGYIAAIVGDILEGSRRLEKIIIALKLDSSPESRAAGLPSIPMVEVFCHLYGDGNTDDKNMLRVISLSAHEIACHVPVRYGAGGGPPPPPPPPPPPGDFVYKPVVKGVLYAFPQGNWAAIALVFPFPVDTEVITAYAANPSATLWVAAVDRMFVRRDD